MRLTTFASSVDKLCQALEQIPAGSLFRHNDAGDLPAVGRRHRFMVTNHEQHKTGKSYRSRTSRSSCPTACALYDICYASVGPISWHWKALGHWVERGAAKLDWRAVLRIAKATRHLTAWTYTHWGWRRYKRTMLRAIEQGFVINASVEDPKEAVAAFHAGLPVTLVALPEQRRPINLDGVPAYVCPALLQENFTCDQCGNGKPLCARADRPYIIMFPAHGSRSRHVAERIESLWRESEAR